MATDYQSMMERFQSDPSYHPPIEDDEQPRIKPQQPSVKQSTRAVNPVSTSYQATSKAYQPASNPRQSRIRPSAIVSGQTIDRGRPIFERLIGLALLILSFMCTVMTFNGYWGKPSIKALAIGIGLQGLATAAEWFWRNQRVSWWYIGAIVFDAGMSVKGFSLPLLSPFKRLVDSVGIIPDKGVPIIAWILIGILSIALAVLPEVILIDKD